MSEAMLVCALDRDAAAHLAVALHRHRDALRKIGGAEPPGLAELERMAVSITRRQEDSGVLTVPAVGDDGPDGHRDWLSRSEVAWLLGVSLATVDRWRASGVLRSSRVGGIRRFSRESLHECLSARPGVPPAGECR